MTVSPRSRCGFDYERKGRAVTELDRRTRDGAFWNDAEAAQKVMKQLADLREEVDEIGDVARQLADARETLDVLGDEDGAASEVDELVTLAQERVERLEMAANFDREYDSHGAIVGIHAGAGGVDAADWTQMLARMYVRWAERKGFETLVADESPGEEAGLKSITFFVRGRNAYGLLEGERGVHRLVRMSPFDQQHRRHTSFASVDVVPEIATDEKIAIDIKPEDLRIETYKIRRCGRSVRQQNRIRHSYHPPADQHHRGVATGTFAMQNREVAMTMLRSQLVQREIEEREAKLAELRGERRAKRVGFADPLVRVQPYTLVKDHRTNVENGNAAGVLDGDLDGFVWPYLQQRRRLETLAS